MNAIQTAETLLNHDPKIEYRLGMDIIDGKLPALDCSAFIWRCFGEIKYSKKIKRWRNTSWIYTDIASNNTKFDRIDKIEDALPGDVIVYPWKGKSIGHVALIEKYDAEEKDLHVIDCASSKKGITKNVANYFLKKDFVIGRIKCQAKAIDG